MAALVRFALDSSDPGGGLVRAEVEDVEQQIRGIRMEIDGLTDAIRGLAEDVDALGPSVVATSQILSHWIAQDPDNLEAGETSEMLEDRLLNDVLDISEKTWALIQSGLEDTDRTPPGTRPNVGHGGSMDADVDALLSNASDGVFDRWVVPARLLRRATAWSMGKGCTTSRGLGVALELGLSCLESGSVPDWALPRLRAALAQLHESLSGIEDRHQEAARVLGELATHVVGIPYLLIHWLAQDESLAVEGSAEITAEERETSLAQHFHALSTSLWAGLRASRAESEIPVGGTEVDD